MKIAVDLLASPGDEETVNNLGDGSTLEKLKKNYRGYSYWVIPRQVVKIHRCLSIRSHFQPKVIALYLKYRAGLILL